MASRSAAPTRQPAPPAAPPAGSASAAAAAAPRRPQRQDERTTFWPSFSNHPRVRYGHPLRPDRLHYQRLARINSCFLSRQTGQTRSILREMAGDMERALGALRDFTRRDILLRFYRDRKPPSAKDGSRA